MFVCVFACMYLSMRVGMYICMYLCTYLYIRAVPIICIPFGMDQILTRIIYWYSAKLIFKLNTNNISLSHENLLSVVFLKANLYNFQQEGQLIFSVMPYEEIQLLYEQVFLLNKFQTGLMCTFL